MSSVETGCSAARHVQKSVARGWRSSAKAAEQKSNSVNDTANIGKRSCISALRFGVFQSIVQILIAAKSGPFQHTPAVIKMLETNAGNIAGTSVIKSRSHFIDRLPAPNKLDICEIALLADARDLDNLPASGRYVEKLLAGLLFWDQATKNIDAKWRENHVPARWRLNGGRTCNVGAADPTMMLQNQILRRTVIL